MLSQNGRERSRAFIVHTSSQAFIMGCSNQCSTAIFLCREYDRIEAEAAKHRCKLRYSLASADHQSLVKSTTDLACNPKLKEVLAGAAELEELAMSLVSHSELLQQLMLDDMHSMAAEACLL